MAGTFENKVLTHGFGRLSNWQGRSGRAYTLISENFDHFAMDEADLHLLAKGSHVLWVGSTDELVSDPMSRTRFRLALDEADPTLGQGERFLGIGILHVVRATVVRRAVALIETMSRRTHASHVPFAKMCRRIALTLQ